MAHSRNLAFPQSKPIATDSISHLKLVVARGCACDDDTGPEVGLRHRHPVEVRALPLHSPRYGLKWESQFEKDSFKSPEHILLETE